MEYYLLVKWSLTKHIKILIIKPNYVHTQLKNQQQQGIWWWMTKIEDYILFTLNLTFLQLGNVIISLLVEKHISNEKNKRVQHTNWHTRFILYEQKHGSSRRVKSGFAENNEVTNINDSDSKITEQKYMRPIHHVVKSVC